MRPLNEIKENPKLSDVKDLLSEVKRLTYECESIASSLSNTEEDLSYMTAHRDQLRIELAKFRCMGCARPRRWRSLRDEAAAREASKAVPSK